MSRLYDMSVCQPCPASFSPTGLPSGRIWFDRIVEQIGHVHLQVAEPLGEGGESGRVEGLVREAQHPVLAERSQQRAEIAVG
jgi:hypothetical protein